MGRSGDLARSDLTSDALYVLVRQTFDAIPDHRVEPTIPLADALMSAFAMFALKDPSLLAFDRRREDPSDNFRTVFGITPVPCDTHPRDTLDPLDPVGLRVCFRDLFRRVQRGKVLDGYVSLGGRYLISL